MIQENDIKFEGKKEEEYNNKSGLRAIKRRDGVK
jgi:hypothetical protein